MKVVITIHFLLIPIGCAAFGTYFLMRCRRNYLKAQATYDWPSTPGTVVVSEIKEMGPSDNLTYDPIVTYEYHLDGKAFRSSKLKIADEFLTDGSYAQAEELTRNFPIGRNVDVIYNPDAPQESVLVEGIISKSLWLGMGIAMFFYIMAALAFAYPGFPFV
jgi:hypothetical protein